MVFGQRMQRVAAVALGAECPHVAQKAAGADAAFRVGDEQVRMRALVRADAAAGAAGALRIVEHEEVRHDVAEDQGMGGAAEGLRELLCLGLRRTANDGRGHQRIAHAQRVFNRRLELPLDVRRNRQLIDQRRELGIAGQALGHFLGEVDALAVDVHEAAAELADFVEDELRRLAVHLEDRRPQLHLGARRQGEERFEDLRCRLRRHRFVRVRAVGFADGGEEQVQVAGNVGERAHGGARVAGDGLLLDGDHRRQAVDVVDVRLLHLRDEALGVGGERLHVAPLPFRVDGVEGERRLAGAGEAGDHGEPIARNLDRDVLQVVDASALHGDGGAHRRRLAAARLAFASRLRGAARWRAGFRPRPWLRHARTHHLVWKNASSSTSIWLRVVSFTDVAALSMTPMSESHSQAMITCSMSWWRRK